MMRSFQGDRQKEGMSSRGLDYGSGSSSSSSTKFRINNRDSNTSISISTGPYSPPQHQHRRQSGSHIRNVWNSVLHKSPTTATPKLAGISLEDNGHILDPHFDSFRTFSLDSPEPTSPGGRDSIENFLNEFSSEKVAMSGFEFEGFDNFPEGTGKRPESPEGKTRSRPMTPSLDRDFDLRSLNITPEPVLNNSSAANFDDPPPYNPEWGVSNNPPSWNSGSSRRKPVGSSAWFNDPQANRASFHSLEDLEPPSYPSLTETPGRHTWAGDVKDETMLTRYFRNPDDAEAAEYIRGYEQAAIAARTNVTANSSTVSVNTVGQPRRRRDSNESNTEEVSPGASTFTRPRRDTGAWWLGPRNPLQTEGDENECDSKAEDQDPKPSSGSLNVNSSTELPSDEIDLESLDLETLPHPSVFSNNLSDETQMAIDSETAVTTVIETKDLPHPSSFHTTLLDPSASEEEGICGLCNADLRYREGDSMSEWYMKLKNHFLEAHGSWYDRMPGFYGSSADVTASTEALPNSPETEPKVASVDDLLPKQTLNESNSNSIPSPPDPIVKSEHECQLCQETFQAFKDLNIHMFDRHGVRGMPLGVSTSKTPRKRPDPFAPFNGIRKRSEDKECYAFGCTQWFHTADERDEHMERTHGFGSRPAQVDPGYSDKELVMEDFEVNAGSSASSTSEDIASVEEIKQLWQGFSASIQMNEDIQHGSAAESSTTYSYKFGVNVDEPAGPFGELSNKPIPVASPRTVAHHDEDMFNSTLAELFKVTCKASGSDTTGVIPSSTDFDMDVWLQSHLVSLGPEAARQLVNSEPSYYENLLLDEQAAEWVQKVREGLSRVKEQGTSSSKGKERARSFGSPVETLPIISKPIEPLNIELSLRDPLAEDASRIKLAKLNSKFLAAAQNAYEKLQAGTLRDGASKEFIAFVASLGSVNDIIDVGMNVVDMILAKDVPRSLIKVYCFLHVAYAISQTESDSEKTNEAEFRAGLSLLRDCLPITAEPGMPSERDIFDEIASVMWEELEFALKWIEKWDGNEALNQAGCPVNQVEGLKHFMRNHCTSPDPEDVSMGLNTIDPKLLLLGSGGEFDGLETVESDSLLTSWDEIVECGIFTMILRFLKEFKETGIIFAYLCGGLCSSFATGFKKRVKFKDRRPVIEDSSTALQLQNQLQQDVVVNLSAYGYNGVKTVTNTAMSMLKRGYVSTIRDFENYLIDLTRVRKRTQSEFSSFLSAIVWNCNSCATFAPDNLWSLCRGQDEPDYGLDYAENRVGKELGWYTGKPFEQDVTARHMSISDELPPIIQDITGEAMEIDPALIQPLNVGMCSIDTLLQPPTPTRSFHQPSPAGGSVTSNSPNNYDSLWENSPIGCKGSETSYSNPNSTNITPDEIYVNPNMPNANIATDYFTYFRPQPVQPQVAEPVVPTTKSRKRKYLEGDGTTSFPARRRKVAAVGGGKRLYCDVAGCEEFASTSSNLSRHKRTKHGNAAVREASFHCEGEGCDRVFYGTRGKGNLRTHMRKDHGR